MSNTQQTSQSLREWMDIFMHRSMRGWNRFAKTTGLSMPQFSILMQLHYRGACGISEISDRFDITTAAASQLTDKLVQSGLLERAEDPSDRRAKQINLSPKGTKLVHEGLKERYRWMETLTRSLTAEEQTKVAEALVILTEAAQKLDQSR
jgi:DNA-binding MarR family transcriptional regulator